MAVIQKIQKVFRKKFLEKHPCVIWWKFNTILIEIFCKKNVASNARRNVGLQNVFKSAFPIKDYAGIADLEFVEYTLDKPLYNVKECMLRNMTYSARLKLKLKLIIWDVAEKWQEKHFATSKTKKFSWAKFH